MNAPFAAIDCTFDNDDGNSAGDRDHRGHHTPTDAALRTIRAGHATGLGPVDGELIVVAGRIWLTREGQLQDHVAEAGERLQITARQRAVIESADAGRDALVRWLVRDRRFVGAAGIDVLRSTAWHGVAALASSLAVGFAAVAASARSAAGPSGARNAAPHR